MKKYTGKRITYIIMDIFMQLLCLFPWLTVGGNRYNAIWYLYRMSGDPVKVFAADKYGGDFASLGLLENDVKSWSMALYAELCFMVAAQAILLVHLLLNLTGKMYADLLPGIALMVSSITIFTSYMGDGGDTILTYVYPAIIFACYGFVTVGGKMAEAWNEAARQEKERKDARKQLKKEKAVRLKFDGKYSRDFYRMAWKNFKHNGKDYRLLLGAGAVSCGLLFVSSGMQELMSGMNTHGKFYNGRGVDAVLMNFFLVFTVLAVFLITYILTYYLKNRMKGFGLLMMLGIRQKAMKLLVAFELAASVILSLAGGLIVGNVLLFGFCKAADTLLAGRIVLGTLTLKTYGKTLAMTLLVFAFAFLFTFAVYKETNVMRMKSTDVAREKMPGKLRYPGLVIGIILALAALLTFSKIQAAEGSGVVLLFALGLYLILRNGWGIFLKQRRSHGRSYYQKLIPNHMLYHKFQRASRYVFLLTVIHICTFVLFSKDAIAIMIAPEPERELPYDYVCMANSEDDALMDEIKEYGAEVLEYPMVRATTVDRTLRTEDFRQCILPQGQNIGISESTYYELKKLVSKEKVKLPDLDAEGKRIYVVYQQDIGDNAKPLDYYFTRTNPYIFIGQPLTGYWFLSRDKIYMPRTIAGSETGSLVGVFREGVHENVVVFSDAYFESVKDNWKHIDNVTGKEVSPESAGGSAHIREWPTRLVLIRLNGAEQEKVEGVLAGFKENHKEDEHYDSNVLSYYEKEETVTEKEAERLLKEISNGFIVVILLLISLLILYMKVQSELAETRSRYEFLNYMGMPQKERIQSIRKEISRFVRIPLAVTAVVVPVYTVLVWRLRHFTGSDMMRYVQIMAVEALIYAVVQILAMLGLQYYVIRKVEGKQAWKN